MHCMLISVCLDVFYILSSVIACFKSPEMPCIQNRQRQYRQVLIEINVKFGGAEKTEDFKK